jgi:hypothetical protein
MYSQITDFTRNSYKKKITKHKKINYFALKIYQNYCSLTGIFHQFPNYLIIGAAKCGTSSLYRYLNQHPEIKPALTKEVRFFDKYYDRGINRYRVSFPFKDLLRRKYVTGESTPRYLDHPHAPKRIKAVIPNARFIVLLRNPIDRAYSMYNMRVRTRRENLSFDEAIKQEKKRTEGEFQKMELDENYYSRPYFHHAYLDRGIYVDKLQRWMTIFPKEQFLIIKSEDLFKNTSETYNKVLKFLGLPPHELNSYPNLGGVNKMKPIEPPLRKQLTEFFKPHNERLYKFLGKNFDWESKIYEKHNSENVKP